MGLFDNIKISKDTKLPDTEFFSKTYGININTLDFQTKDIECWMESFKIKGLGGKKYKLLNKNSKLQKFTGDLQFYEFIDLDFVNHDLWVEYNFLFKDGIGEYVSHRVEKQDNKERLFNRKIDYIRSFLLKEKQNKISFKLLQFFVETPISHIMFDMRVIFNYLSEKITKLSFKSRFISDRAYNKANIEAENIVKRSPYRET